MGSSVQMPRVCCKEGPCGQVPRVWCEEDRYPEFGVQSDI